MEYAVTRQFELTTHDGTAIQEWVDVEFKVGTDGPFTERFTKADYYTAGVVALRLQQRAAVVKSIRG